MCITNCPPGTLANDRTFTCDIAWIESYKDEFSLKEFNSYIYPDCALLSTKKLVVFWHAIDFTINGKILESSKLLTIKSKILNNQLNVKVSSSKTDQFLVVWQTKSTYQNDSGIFGMLYSNDGNPQGNEFLINKYLESDQKNPSLSYLPNGSWIVTWSSNAKNTLQKNFDIFTNIVNVEGKTVNPNEIRITSPQNNSQENSDVAVFSDGSYVIVWQSNIYEFGWDIYGQINGVMTDLLINTKRDKNQISPKVTVLSNDNWVVVWEGCCDQEDENVGNGSEIYAQSFWKNGSKLGYEVLVNTVTFRDQQNPSILALSHSRFLISWSSNQGLSVNNYEIFGQLYNSYGKIGNEFKISRKIKSKQTHPSLSTIGVDDDFLAVWEDETEKSIYGQRWNITSELIDVEPNDVMPQQTCYLLTYCFFSFPLTLFKDSKIAISTYNAILKGSVKLPRWLSLNPDNRSFSGIPPNKTKDVYGEFLWIDLIAITFVKAASVSFPLRISKPPLKIENKNYIIDSIISVGQHFKYTIPDPNTIFIDPLKYSLSFQVSYSTPNWIRYHEVNFTFLGQPTRDNRGMSTVTLTAYDKYGFCDSLSFKVFVKSIPPIFNKPDIPNFNLIGGHSFTFIIPENQFVSNFNDVLTLKNGSALPFWLNFNGKVLQGNPLSNDSSIYSLSITAFDGFDSISSNTFYFTLTPNSAPIVANIIPDKLDLKLGEPFSYSFSNNIFYDKDNDSLSYTIEPVNLTFLPTWLKFSNERRTFMGTPTTEQPHIHTIKVIANDGSGGVNSTQFKLGRINNPPVVIRNLSELEVIVSKQFDTTILNTFFSDIDLDILTFSAKFDDKSSLDWIEFKNISYSTSSNSTITYFIFYGKPITGTQGLHNITIIAKDEYGGEDSTSFTLKVNNIGPQVNSLQDHTVSVGELFNYTLSDSIIINPAANRLIITAVIDNKIESNIPDWLHFNHENLNFNATPKSGSQGEYKIKLIVKDEYNGKASSTFVLKVLNRNPAINDEIPNQSLKIGEIFNFTIPENAFIDEDKDILYYKATFDPNVRKWLSFNPLKKSFTGTPISGNQGIYSIAVTAFDDYKGEASAKFYLDVVNTPPILAKNLSNVTGTPVGSHFEFNQSKECFKDADNDTLIYSSIFKFQQAWPRWIDFNSSSLSFTVNPISESIGDHIIRIYAADAFNKIAYGDFTLTIPSQGLNTKTKIQNQIIYVDNKQWNFQIPMNAFISLDNLQLVYDSKDFPDWLFITKFGTIYGKANENDIGKTFELTVIAEDNKGGKAYSHFSVTVQKFTNNQLQKISDIPGQKATVHKEFHFSFDPNKVFANPSSNTITYTALANNDPLPRWLKFYPSPNEIKFEGTPDSSDHFSELEISLNAKTAQEEAYAIFKIIFENHVPKSENPRMSIELQIGRTTTIPLGFTDEDGDIITCELIGINRPFIQLDKNLCICLFSPKPEDNKNTSTVIIVGSDKFNGKSTVIIEISVIYSDWDQFLVLLKIISPIITAVLGIFGFYKKKGLLWNIFACWSRPLDTVWNLSQTGSYKILDNEYPGWFIRIFYQYDELKNKPNNLWNWFTFHLVDFFCYCCKYRFGDLSSEGLPIKEGLRIEKLELMNLTIEPYLIKNAKNSKILSILNKLTFLDILVRIKINVPSINIICDEKFKLRIDETSKENIRELISKGHQIKLFVICGDGRVLEKILILCEAAKLSATKIEKRPDHIELKKMDNSDVNLKHDISFADSFENSNSIFSPQSQKKDPQQLNEI